VDSYLPLLNQLNDTIDELEDQALNSPTPEVLSTISVTKRTLVFCAAFG
jgi:Mg2+ and Co2+ transporter CorA